MRILLVNDDGYKSIGINILARKLALEHEVLAIAPLVCNSGKSHAMTFNKAVHLQKIKNEDYSLYALSGTPADCVKLGISMMGYNKPDLIISGVNNQYNLGTDVMYSGTVNAALQGSICGFKALAVSTECKESDEVDFEYVIDYFIKYLPLYLQMVTEQNCISININPPSIGNKGHKIMPLGVREFCDIYLIKSDDTDLISHTLIGHPLEIDNAENTDVFWIKNGYSTITPLHTDLTAYKLIKEFNLILDKFSKEKK